MENFLEIDFKIEPTEPGRDILLAVLDGLNYDSFQETEEGLKAYILEESFDENQLKNLPLFKTKEFKISFQKEKLENRNWNEEWETFYDPIFIDEKIHIRAPFHPKKQEFPIEVLITPKMSFGTGHHQTTRLMAQQMLQMDFTGKTVLDMGTGTGVLAILAEKLGAKKIAAIDNFEWAVENTRENAEANHCAKVSEYLGDAEILENKKFDIVLANINRNVLLEDMKTYAETLPTGGEMLLSGFLQIDFEKIQKAATDLGFSLVKKTEENDWNSALYILK